MPSDDDDPDASPTRPQPRWQQATAAPAPRRQRSDDQHAPVPRADRFAIGDELGRGGMGYVVAATDTLLERPVAIKQALLDDPEGLRRFEREARITAQLEHPSIVPVHDAGVDELGRPYYVMRRVEGEPLADRVARAPEVAARLALVGNVLAAVDAAAFAHARGVIHRDIKPGNILVGAYGETLLIDWGIAVRIDDGAAGAEDRDRGAGTPGYMAPEQARGGAADPRADVYALGATLLHVLTGAAVIDGSATAWLARVVAGAPPPAGKVPPEVPGELVAIVGKAMAAAPEQRYRDAGELARDLRAFLAGQLVAAHRYTALERVARFVRRHRVAVATAAAAVIAIVAIGVAAIRGVVRERDRATEARADAEAGQRLAADRAEVLLLDRASTLAPRAPTRAVALLRLLPPGSRHLARARDIAAIAAAHGIARGKEAHAGAIRALEIAPDGHHLLSAGEDGTLQVHDLDTGASRTIVRGGRRISGAVWTHGGRTVTYAADDGLAVVEVSTAAARSLDPRASVESLQPGARDDRVRYLDRDRGLLLERAAEPGTEPAALVGDVRLFAIRGDRLVVAGAGALRLVDLDRPGRERVLWRDPLVAHVASIDLSPDGTRAVTASQHGVIEWDLATATEARRWPLPSTRAFYAGTRLYATNLARGNAIDRLGSARTVEAVPGDWSTARVTPTAAGVALVNEAGALWIIDDHGEVEVVHEERATRGIAGRAGSPYVAIASSSGGLRWWDTRALLPRSWAIEPSSQLCAIDAERIYLATMTDVAVLPRGAGPPRTIATAPFPCGGGHGRIVVRAGADAFDAIDGATGEPRRVTGALPTPRGDAVYYVDHAREVHELAAGASRLRWRGAAAIIDLAVGRTTVAIGLAGQLARFDRATGAAQTIAAPPGIGQLAVADDGGVWFSVGTQIERWGDAGARPVATVPDLSHLLGVTRGGAAVAVTRDGAAWTLAPGGVPRRATDPSRRAVFDDARVVATLDVPSGVTLTYLDSGERIARSVRDATSLAADDRGLVVIRGDTGELLQLYQDPVPADPAGLPAWIDATTNAVVDPGRDELTWR